MDVIRSGLAGVNKVNVVDHFDSARIINVPARRDRRQETIEEFARNGFQIDTAKVRFFEALAPAEAAGFPSAGARGCFLSHLGVLKEASRSAVGNVLVLEDDIQFSRHISQYGPRAVEALQRLDWDIAYLGCPLRGEVEGAAWARVEKPMLLAHFYAVNGRSIDRLVRFLHRILERPPGHPDGGPMHYDGALNTFMQQNSDIQAYYFTLSLGYQRPSPTDIHARSVFDENPLLRPVTKVMRKVKAKILSRTR